MTSPWGFYHRHESYEGIWDCMSSQQAINFVRLKIFEGQELNQISEMLCDYCLAPESIPSDHLRCGGCGQVYCIDCADLLESGRMSDGCDNMTVVIIAILNGRTKDEWYTWITDRVKENYGYKTPRSLPQIYPEDKLKSFKAQRERKEERDRKRASGSEDGSSDHDQFVVMEDATGGLALMGSPTGLRGNMVKNALLGLLTRT
jgi:protein phosphatase PTC2/3